MSRIALLASGDGDLLQAVIAACADGSLAAEVVALGTDRKCRAVQRAAEAGTFFDTRSTAQTIFRAAS